MRATLTLYSVTGHRNNMTKTAQTKADKYPTYHFHRFTLVQVLICSLKKGLTPKIRTLCFVLINRILFNLLYVGIFIHCPWPSPQLATFEAERRTAEAGELVAQSKSSNYNNGSFFLLPYTISTVHTEDYCQLSTFDGLVQRKDEDS